MHLAAVDHMANNGDSFLHRASPLTKVFISLLFLTGMILSDSILKSFVLMGITITLIILSKVDGREIFHLALYPVFFSIVFALLKLQESWTAGVLVMMKALGAALNMLLLITTTPYTDIFGIFSYIMPSVMVDVFIFTYRSLFILLDRLESLFKSIRLRGGYNPMNLLFNLKNSAGAIGVMIINAVDMSERLYRIYTLRGYSGKISFNREWQSPGKVDVLLMLFSAAVMIGVMIPWNI